jgi:hypothetical protein
MSQSTVYSPQSTVHGPQSTVHSLQPVHGRNGDAEHVFGSWVLDRGLETADCGLWTVDSGLWTD